MFLLPKASGQCSFLPKARGQCVSRVVLLLALASLFLFGVKLIHTRHTSPYLFDTTPLANLLCKACTPVHIMLLCVLVGE